MQKKIMSFLKRGLPYLVLLAAYLMSVGIFALYGEHNLDSDMSSEMILASILNEEGGLFSEEWYYSTELRVVSPVMLYQIGLKLFDSWHAARTFAVAVLQIGVILSFLFMAKAAGMKESGVYCAAGLILPISQAYAFLFAYGGFYAAYFIWICIVFGMILRMHGSKRKVLLCVFMALSGVWGGMTGVRMIMLLGAPLMLACSVALFDQFRRSQTGKAVIESEQFSMMLATLIHFAGMLAGYWINGHVLAQKYSFSSQNDVKLVPFGPQSVLDQMDCMLRFFGYQAGYNLLSVEGAASWAAVALVCFSMLAVYVLLKKRVQYGLTACQQMVPLFACCALVLGILLNGSTDRGHNGYNEVHTVAYYISGVLMMVASACMLLEKLPCRLWQHGTRTLLLLMLSGVFFLEARVYTKNDYRSSMADYEDAAQWLVEHGYTQGFSTFWNGNVLTEATDGQLEMYVFSSWTHDEFGRWLQKKSHFEQLPEGKVFVYVESMEEFLDPSPCADEQRMIYESTGGRAYEYDSAQEVLDIQKAHRAKVLEERNRQQE